jgi:hypothetical protein
MNDFEGRKWMRRLGSKEGREWSTNKFSYYKKNTSYLNK